MPLDLLLRDARPRPSTFNAEAGTVEAVVATNAPVARRDAAGTFGEILDPNGADLDAMRDSPVLDSHRQDGLGRVLGAVDDARIEGGSIVATIRFSRRPDLQPIIDDVRSGVLKHFSVGYQVNQWADGRDQSGKRTRTAVRWTPREVSIVSVPADPACRTRTMPDDTQVAEPPADDRAQVNRSIRELAVHAGVAANVTDGLIDRGATVEEARSEILDALLTRGQQPIRTAHRRETYDDPQFLIRVAGEALFSRTDAAHQVSEAARPFVGLSIPELARECLRRSGISTTGLSADTVITRAVGFGAHTTSDFPLILGNAVERTLRQSYGVPRSSIKMVARQSSAADFRAKTRLQLDSSGLALEKVNEAGEFRNGSLAEAGESYRLSTYGKIIGLTRQLLINDDVAAFTDVARRLGQAAASSEAQWLVDLLQLNGGLGPVMSDGLPLFHASHGNLAATGAVLDLGPVNGVYPLSDARLAMRKQVGPSGGLISVTPRWLVVPGRARKR